MTTTAVPTWVVINGVSRRITHAIDVPKPHDFPRYAEYRPRLVVELAALPTSTADYAVVHKDELHVGYAPRALPQRIPPRPSRNPMRLTTPERGLWWCITVGTLLWAGVVTALVETIR